MIENQHRIGFRSAMAIFLSVFVIAVSSLRDADPQQVVNVHAGKNKGSYVLGVNQPRLRRIETRLATYGDKRQPARLGTHRFVVETACFYRQSAGSPPQEDSDRTVAAASWKTVAEEAAVKQAAYELSANQSKQSAHQAPLSLGLVVTPRIKRGVILSSAGIGLCAVLMFAVFHVVFPHRQLSSHLVMEDKTMEVSARHFRVQQSAGNKLIHLGQLVLLAAACAVLI